MENNSPIEFINAYEKVQKGIMVQLHNLLLSYPKISSKMRFKWPFYFGKSWICYFNPVKSGGIELAFTRANEMSNSNGLLDFKGRSQVGSILLSSLKEINELVYETIQEAIVLDETVKYQSKRK